MRFDTKFTVGDQVYLINGHQVKTAVIIELNIRMSEERRTPSIIYAVKINGSERSSPIEEEYLFASKEELINSL
jgi:hypothetical protein